MQATSASLIDAIKTCLKNARQAPTEPRIPLEIAGQIVGSMLARDAELLLDDVPGLIRDGDSVAIAPRCASDSNAVLAAMAQSLRAAERIAGWRNELLAVTADDGTELGHLERACARTLGIRTVSVHLVGECQQPEDAYWLQRRALNKSSDPGMLDNLAAGLVSVDPTCGRQEALIPAMIREVSEEAGLSQAQYQRPEMLGRWRFYGHVREGYLIEDVCVFRSTIAAGVLPQNLDGEVSEFLCLGLTDLLAVMEQGELTLGATLSQLVVLLAKLAPNELAGIK